MAATCDLRGFSVLDDITGKWLSAPLVVPAGLVAAYHFHSGDTTAMVKNGFTWSDTTNIYDAAPGETEAGLKFTMTGTPSPASDSMFEQRFSFPEMAEVWVKTRIHIPTNYFHRFCTLFSTEGDITNWQAGHTVVAQNGTSSGTIFSKDGQNFYLIFADDYNNNFVWDGPATNTTIDETVTVDRVQFEVANNKLFVLWCDGYSVQGQGASIGFEMDPNPDDEGYSTVYYHWGADGTVVGHPDHANSTSAKVPFIRYNDLGKWFDVIYRYKLASTEEALDGINAMYLKREGEAVYTKLLEQTNAGTGPRALADYALIRNGYCYGAWNSGVTETTEMRISEFELYSSRPSELGDA